VIPDIGCKEPIVSSIRSDLKYLNKVRISDGNIKLALKLIS
jgi:hypothetical protein